MALTNPIPPTGLPRPGADLAGMVSMMGGTPEAKAVQTEALLQKLRPALRLLEQLETMVNKDPEIMPLVQTIVTDKFGGKGSKRGNTKAAVPQPPLAPGMPGAPPGAPPVMAGPAALPPLSPMPMLARGG